MSVDPDQVIRVYPPQGTPWRLANLRDHPETGAVQLTAADLSCTTAERLGCWMGYEMVAGFAADHGEVADEAAMLALHNWEDDSRDTPEYHYIAPGDSCTRADDPGYRWHCLSGRGRYLADWERRPLVAPIAALEARADAMEIELAGKIGSAALDGYVTDAALTTALESHTHSLSQLTQSSATAGQVPTWSGSAWVPQTPATSGGATISPADIDGLLELHHVFAPASIIDPSGVQCVPGASVASWLDMSGAARALGQSVAAQRPVLTADGWVGMPSTSEYQCLERAANLASEGVSDEFTVYIVRRRTAWTAGVSGQLYYSGAGGTPNRIMCHGPLDNGTTYYDAGDYSGARSSGAVSWSSGRAHSVTLWRRGSSSRLLVNGAVALNLAGSAWPDFSAAATTLILGGASSQSQRAHADIAVYALYSRALMEWELAALDRWAFGQL